MTTAPTTGIDRNKFKPHDSSSLTKEQRAALDYLQSEGFEILGRRTNSNGPGAIFVYHPGYDHYTSIHSGSSSGVTKDGMVTGLKRQVAKLKRRQTNTMWLVIEYMREKYQVDPFGSMEIRTKIKREATEAKANIPELATRSIDSIAVALSQSEDLKTVERVKGGASPGHEAPDSTFLLLGRHFGIEEELIEETEALPEDDDALLDQYGFKRHGKQKVRDPRGGAIVLRHAVLHRLRDQGKDGQELRASLQAFLDDQEPMVPVGNPLLLAEAEASVALDGETQSLPEPEHTNGYLDQAKQAVEDGSYGGAPGDFVGTVERPIAPCEDTDPHEPHDWQQGGYLYHCLGVAAEAVHVEIIPGTEEAVPEPHQEQVPFDFAVVEPPKDVTDLVTSIREAHEAADVVPTAFPEPRVRHATPNLPGVPAALQGAIQELLAAYSSSTENERVKLSLVQEELTSARHELHAQLGQLTAACKAISRSITTVDGLLKLIGES